MKKTSLRIMLLTTIVTVLMVVTMTISSTVFSTVIATPVAFGERIVLDSEQSVTATTNGIDQNNDTDRHTSSLRITQSPENGLDVECGGDLKCKILDNNTVVATTGQNTTTMITNTLNAFNQSLIQSLNQSNILVPFDDNDSGILNEQDLDSEIDKWIDRMLNETLGDLRAPLQIPPDWVSVSV
ncbi:MAG: hypothetical protein ACJ70M_03895 [Nitrososphaera sp.]